MMLTTTGVSLSGLAIYYVGGVVLGRIVEGRIYGLLGFADSISSIKVKFTITEMI